MEYFKLYSQVVLYQLVRKTPLVDSYFDSLRHDIVNNGRIYYGQEDTMMALLQ